MQSTWSATTRKNPWLSVIFFPVRLKIHQDRNLFFTHSFVSLGACHRISHIFETHRQTSLWGNLNILCTSYTPPHFQKLPSRQTLSQTWKQINISPWPSCFLFFLGLLPPSFPLSHIIPISVHMKLNTQLVSRYCLLFSSEVSESSLHRPKGGDLGVSHPMRLPHFLGTYAGHFQPLHTTFLK